MRARIAVLVLVTSVCFLALSEFTVARAIRFAGGERIVIAADHVVPDDLYVAGREILIQGSVQGDVYAIGQRVVIGPKARIDGDLVAAARIVDVQGVVEDDVRVVGSVVRIGGPYVGDDVMAAGFSVEVAKGTRVGGSLLAGAYQVYLGGNVSEDMWVGANGILIAGQIEGNVKANVGERGGPPPAFWAFFTNTRDITLPAVASGLTVGPDAHIGGDLVYQSVQAASIAPGAVIQGNVIHRLPPRPAQKKKPPTFGTLPWVFSQARRFVTYLAIGILLFLITPTTGRRFGRLLLRRPLAALGWGVVTVAVIIAALILVLLATVLAVVILRLLTLTTLMRWVLVVGLLIDILTVVGYLAYTALIAPVLVPYALLSPLDRGGTWWLVPLIVGVAMYLILVALPYVGWLIALLVVLLGLGGGVLLYRRRAQFVG